MWTRILDKSKEADREKNKRLFLPGEPLNHLISIWAFART